MRSREQILAEVVDSLVRQGEGRIPPEIGQLAEIGARLRNECPDADPAFLRRLEQRLRAECAPPGRVRSLLTALSGWRPRFSPGLLRTAAGVLVTALLLGALSARAPLLRTAQASLGQAISLLRHARIEQSPDQVGVPSPETTRVFSGLEEAQAAGFAIRTPAYLPPELALANVQVIEGQGQQRFVLQYTSLYAQLGAGREYVTIQQFRIDDDGEATITLRGDLSDVERLDVAGRTALWFPREQGPEGLREGWESGKTLLVQDGDILIQLFGTLGRDVMVRIAASMFR